jgi:integrase
MSESCTRVVTSSSPAGGGPASTWAIDRAMRRVRKIVPGLPETFVFHDLRHFFASSLIEAGLDVKRVQALLRHASAKTTLDTYGHLFPNQDDAVRAKLGTFYAAQPEADGLVTLQRQTG